MRFDLTHASFRVLQRSSKQQLPSFSSDISAAKLLLSLFEEEECRAADWLTEAGLSPGQFRTDFQVGAETASLAFPISAPSFPTGDYGVPADMARGTGADRAGRIGPSPADDAPAQIGNPDFGPGSPTEGEEPASEHRSAPPREPDQWTPSGEQDEHERRFYSIHSAQPVSANRGRSNRARFYLEDMPVQVGRLTESLEANLEIVRNRIDKRERSQRRVSTADGGLSIVSGSDTDFLGASEPLATEHLLLAAACDEEDVGLWLRDHGFEPNALFDRIEQMGVRAGNGLPFYTNDHDVPCAIGDVEIGPVLNPDGDDEPEPVPRRLASGDHDERLARLLDASANRAREAVRVIEDFVRFVLDDPGLTARLKDFRHELQEILTSFSRSRRLRARDTDRDVGTGIEAQGEYRRETVQDVLDANFARLQESLRSLEEFSKIGGSLGDASAPRRLEQLRYRSYTLHKIACSDLSVAPDAVDLAPEPIADRSELLHDARLYALIDTGENDDSFSSAVRELIEGGVDLIQLRDKKADDRTLLERAKRLCRLAESGSRRVLVIVNDRPDLAKLAGADGVHVGQEELPVDSVRKIVGPDMLIGVSTHDIGQARQAVLDGADYIGVGPVFESATKSFEGVYDTLPGPDFLKQVAGEIELPAFAIGGISETNLDTVLECGIRRIVAGAALFQDGKPREAAEHLRKRLDAPEPRT